jgi:hypothetical protein
MMQDWPQDDIDNAPLPFKETLVHFDYTNPEDVEAAHKFRDAKLPFKFINVPKWSLLEKSGPMSTFLINLIHTGKTQDRILTRMAKPRNPPTITLRFLSHRNWSVEAMGIPPTRNNN